MLYACHFLSKCIKIVGHMLRSPFHNTHLWWSPHSRIFPDVSIFIPLLLYFSGLFVIDPEGKIRHTCINDLPVGRSVDETLRLIKAFQYFDKHGEGLFTLAAVIDATFRKSFLQWFFKNFWSTISIKVSMALIDNWQVIDIVHKYFLFKTGASSVW